MIKQSESLSSSSNSDIDKNEPFLVLGHDLRGFFNKSNPFRSQIISFERNQLLTSIVKTDNMRTSFNRFNQSGKNIHINNFTITSDTNRSSKNWGELIKNSFERNTLKMGNTLRRTTGSGVSFSKKMSKTIHQSDYIASRFLNHVMKNKSNSKENVVERKTLHGLNKILKKTRTPILNFIDNKNFVIAGADYLRVYHISENLW